MTRGRRPERVAVFGGTFNPVHVAHLRAAEEVREALELDRVLFVPAAAPPHKSAVEDDPIASAELRLAWLRAATATNPAFAVDPLEIERGGTSWSVDTLRALAGRTSPERPVFVIGTDAFRDLDSWREPRALFSLAHFAVVVRPPAAEAKLGAWLPDCVRGEVELAPDGASGRLPAEDTWIRVVPITPLDVSASDVRARLREGRSVRYLIPESVHDAVVASGVYGGAPGPQERRSRREDR